MLGSFATMEQGRVRRWQSKCRYGTLPVHGQLTEMTFRRRRFSPLLVGLYCRAVPCRAVPCRAVPCRARLGWAGLGRRVLCSESPTGLFGYYLRGAA